MKIKIYGDGANIKDMIKARDEGIVKGFTTNPTLMAKAGITDYEKFAKDVLKEITELPISFEVFSDDFDEMERQALLINSWGDNVNIKIPITNTKGESSVPLISKLLKQGVKLNVTAIFTLGQLEELQQAIYFTDSIILSVFAGRIADAGADPMPMLKKARNKLFGSYDNVEILWASTREVFNIIQAEKCGCDIITVTYDIIDKLKNIGKELNQFSLETVQMFYNDAKKSGFSL